MTLDPIEQYPITPNGDDGQRPAEATIDEQSKHLAMAKAMFENTLSQREKLCADEVVAAIESIRQKHHCIIVFVESRDIIADRVLGVGIKAMAVERTQQQQAAG